MKAALYAAGREQEVKLYLSLDLKVDRLWHGRIPESAKDRFDKQTDEGTGAVLFMPVSSGMPLQWASRLSGKKVDRSAESWSSEEWEQRIRDWLGKQLEAEDPRSISARLGIEGGYGLIGEGEMIEGGSVQRLWERAERLSVLLEGRSLLSGELISMIRELTPDLERDWQSIAQLAYLQGRLKLLGAVAQTGEAGRSERFGKLRQAEPERVFSGRAIAAAARQAAHRCVRCGSDASGGPCAACGSADCARCEACRALGRSRSCELLLQGMPRIRRGGLVRPGCAAPGSGLPAAAQPEAALRARLARWKLSPAQTAAAELAVRFLEEEPGPVRPGSAGRELRRGGGFFAARAGFAAAAQAAMRLSAVWASAGMRPDTSRFAAADPASRFLLWAVTGAGKTEMLFPLIESVRSRGGRVLVATPRRDVVLELAPRLRKAFPGEALVALYGGSEERWRRGGITLATTHQLLRFSQEFDLVVIDELDAFPFHGDPMLSYAAEVCRASGGKTVYLSATPPRKMQSLVHSGRLACAKVPVRYHRHPLPVPELLRVPPLPEYLRRGRLPASLLHKWKKSLKRGAQIFIFVPRIAYAQPLALLLRGAFPGIPVGATSSQDGERGEKVLSFRSTDLRILVTTTILERGVTVPRSDVYVLDADSGLFDEASLVQMAGRAGRSADDPSGSVVFAAVQSTKAQTGARRQIRRMNKLARPFLLPHVSKRGSREMKG